MTRNNDVSATVEQEIDAALKTLAEVQAPTTMASRIQRSLEAASAAAQPTRSWLRLWVPATCAALGIILFTTLLQTHIARGKRAHTAETAKLTTNSGSPRPTIYPSAPVPVESSHVRKVSTPKTRNNVHGRRHPQYRHAANLFNYPLTQQEKLLVRFVQTATPAEMQTMNPEYQAKVEAQQEAAFVAYIRSGDESSAKETQVAPNRQTTQE